ncbi:hypothetical protein JMN32_04525 [Fulvivirga sp. 29W222]|uniref:PAS domain-containing protein n=1 Tax=Fulvivirga marina TaxID=2494733 RepID=A0A937FWA7_9BACT|nr:hypothetical protein [Fulvivirga marina]MBL6445560.1 hypothetical protein [Fulvivirga marina]
MQKDLMLDNVNLLAIDHWILEEEMTLEQVGEVVPTIFYVINPDLTIRYINSLGYQWLNLESEKSMHKSISIINYYHPDTLHVAKSQMHQFYNLQNAFDIQYDLQKVWYEQDSEYKLSLITTKFSRNLDGLLSTVTPLEELPHLKNRIGGAVMSKS